MSTKNLAHTVIEGGRHRYNKWDRRYSHAETRANEKAYISEVMDNQENWYDYDIEPTRPVSKGFTDKLGPMYRWLAAQCGRPWNEVRSEVAKTFDTRTTAGRHIVFDHLLQSVEETPDLRYGRYYSNPDDWTQSYRRHDFYVDAEGILREKTVIKRKGYNEKVPPYNTQQIANWLSGRVVGKVGNKYFWFIPADKNKKKGGVDRTWRTDWGSRKYYYNYGLRFLYLGEQSIYKTDSLTGLRVKGEDGNYIVIGTEKVWVAGHPASFRQGNKLSTKELNYFNALPAYYQNKILELSPTHPNPPKPDYNRYYW